MDHDEPGRLTRIYSRLLSFDSRPDNERWRAAMRATFERRAGEHPRGWRRLRFGARELASLLLLLARERYGRGLTTRRGRPVNASGSARTPDLMYDLRYAARGLRLAPGFTVVAILALTLGIAASSAMFSIVDAVLLRPLPYPEADRIVQVWETSGTWLRNSAAPANFLDWRAQSTGFEHLAAFTSTTMTLTGTDEALRLSGVRVSGRFFAVMGVTPLHGRTIVPADDDVPADPVVVLSHALWRRQFGADASLVGDSIVLDDRPHTVIGVMPEGFVYPFAGTEFWTPLAFDGEEAQTRGFRYLSMVGRLAEDTTAATAQAELQGIAARLASAYPGANEGVSAHVEPLREGLVGDARPMLLAVLGAIGFVLLIACANVATLMLTRATARQGEVAVRAALGAGRGRIVRQLATESLLLALIAGTLGLFVGLAGVEFLAALVPSQVPLAVPLTLDLRIVGFTFTVALATTLLFGLLPALQATRADVAGALRGGRASTSRGQQRTRAALVIAEVALAAVLLVGAGLMLRSFATLMAEDIGFEPDGALHLRLGLTAGRYQDGEARAAFYEQLLERTRGLPGIERAAVTTSVPLGMPGGALIYTPEGQATHEQDATFRVVSDEYFGALGIPLRGRDFGSADTAATPPVIIVGAELARRAWPGEEAIGKRLKIGNENSPDPWRTIVGVADDVRQWSLELAPRPAIYVPFRQLGDYFAPRDLVLRTAGPPLALAAAARAVVGELDGDVPVDIGTMEDLVARAAAARRFNMQLFTAFAAVALVLASLGLYGVVAYAVTRRAHEIGIRMALGAREGSVVALMLRQGLLLVGIGLALGMLGGIAAARGMESLLYEVRGLDPAILALVAAVLATVGALATMLPAWRATRITPVIALRKE